MRSVPLADVVLMEGKLKQNSFGKWEIVETLPCGRETRHELNAEEVFWIQVSGFWISVRLEYDCGLYHAVPVAIDLTEGLKVRR